MTRVPKSDSVLVGFREHMPRYRLEQSHSLEWLAEAHLLNKRLAECEELEESEHVARADQLKTAIRRFCCSEEKIAVRWSEIKDTTHQEWEEMEVFRPRGNRLGCGLEKRAEFYAEVCSEAAQRIYADQSAPEVAIHVSCTGYVSPSPLQRLVSYKGWSTQTQVTHAYHMGCYAAMPAIRQADALVAANRAARVDILHNEICSLHFDPTNSSPEQLVVQSLFADGHIQYRVAPWRPDVSGLRVLGLAEEMIPDTASLMGWRLTDSHFQMTLDKRVPFAVGQHIRGFVERLSAQVGISPEELLTTCLGAIHPGGPRIIEGVQKTLGLSEEQVWHSKQILLNRGNMSSATVPFILKSMFESTDVASGQRILCLAFGPGLTIAGMVVEKSIASGYADECTGS